MLSNNTEDKKMFSGDRVFFIRNNEGLFDALGDDEYIEGYVHKNYIKIIQKERLSAGLDENGKLFFWGIDEETTIPQESQTCIDFSFGHYMFCYITSDFKLHCHFQRDCSYSQGENYIYPGEYIKVEICQYGFVAIKKQSKTIVWNSFNPETSYVIPQEIINRKFISLSCELFYFSGITEENECLMWTAEGFFCNTHEPIKNIVQVISYEDSIITLNNKGEVEIFTNEEIFEEVGVFQEDNDVFIHEMKICYRGIILDVTIKGEDVRKIVYFEEIDQIVEEKIKEL